MKNSLRLVTILFMVTIISSCQKNLVNPGDVFSYDTDAQKFINSSGISDSTQKIAINSLVKQLKDAALWTKFMAIYPMVGGTANTAKWNLKDARDLDAAYRLTFNGNPVFASTGVLFPTSADYADTHLVDNAIGYNNSAISYYSRTQNTNIGYDMGCTDDIPPYNEMATYSDTSRRGYLSAWFDYTPAVPTLTSTGLFMLSSSATNVALYRNGLNIDLSTSAPVDGYTNMSILIGKSRNGPSGQKECALATIGNALTDAQALTFYNIVQKFETSLSR